MSNIQKWITTENVTMLITALGWLYTHIKKVQAQKGNTVLEKSKLIAYDAVKDASNYFVSNEEKKNKVLHTLYSSLPEKERKYLSEDTAKIIISGVYNDIVKPEIEKSNSLASNDKIDIDLNKSDNSENSEVK